MCFVSSAQRLPSGWRCLWADWPDTRPKVWPTHTWLCAMQTPIDNLAWQPDSYFASAPANASATCEENNVAWLPEDFWASGWVNYRQAAAATLLLLSATWAGMDCKQLTALVGWEMQLHKIWFM